MKDDAHGWLQLCILSTTGLPVDNVANVLTGLRRDPALRDAFAYDEMLSIPVLVHEIGLPLEQTFRTVTDADVTVVQNWLQHVGLKRIGSGTVCQAIDVYARERSYHPVRDWLDNLVWDGQPRLTAWLTTKLGAELTPYTQAVGKMFLIGMVRRIYEPGCKHDYMVILEGPQGALKSTACGVLAGDYFSDHLPDISHKDVSVHLRGKWLIEIAEMHAILASRVETAAVKSFLTRQVEIYRHPYGRYEVREPRQVIFVGTTNRTTYLPDETGNRRFWPVRVGRIDIDGLEDDRDQLFAEAVACYRRGDPAYPDPAFEKQYFEPEQAARFEPDPWEQAIRGYVADKGKVTVWQVAREALFIETQRIGKADSNRIARVLQSLGWQRQQKDWQGNRWWSK